MNTVQIVTTAICLAGAVGLTLGGALGWAYWMGARSAYRHVAHEVADALLDAELAEMLEDAESDGDDGIRVLS